MQANTAETDPTTEVDDTCLDDYIKTIVAMQTKEPRKAQLLEHAIPPIDPTKRQYKKTKVSTNKKSIVKPHTSSEKPEPQKTEPLEKTEPLQKKPIEIIKQVVTNPQPLEMDIDEDKDEDILVINTSPIVDLKPAKQEEKTPFTPWEFDEDLLDEICEMHKDVIAEELAKDRAEKERLLQAAQTFINKLEKL